MEDHGPLEARVVAMTSAGLEPDEIGARLGRSPAHVSRILSWSTIRRARGDRPRYPAAVESRVAALRAAGESDEQIGRRFGRSSTFAPRIVRLTAFRAAPRARSPEPSDRPAT